jgi:ABC-type branched-subunit amino acid transport system ATPase component
MPTSRANDGVPRRVAAASPLLSVQGLSAGYGGSPVVEGVELVVHASHVVCVLGPNGAGKSTILKAIVGGRTLISGRVVLAGSDVTGLGADALARRGVGYVPQVRECFDTLTVRENLEMGGYLFRKHEVRERAAEVLEVFPALAAMLGRRVHNLSGGERKMVAIGRVLMSRPSLLLMDEPTAGLAPGLSALVLRDHVQALASRGVGVLLVEQKARAALEVSDWAYIIADRRVRTSGPAGEFLERPDLGSLLLGTSASTARAIGEE